MDNFPSRIRDLLNPVGRKLGLGEAMDSGRVFERWDEIVGPEIASHVKPTSLRDGVLRVRTTSPAWGTEIAYLAEDLMARLNRALGKQVVVELKVSGTAPEVADHRLRPPASRPVEVIREAAESDPVKAFERARRAWAERDRKRHSDQGF
jgi:predicted nucleic acid-binding Zn ribbon protein